MNLSQKIVLICKTIQDKNLFSAIDAGELHLCTKCQEFKKSNDFGKINIGVRHVKI